MAPIGVLHDSIHSKGYNFVYICDRITTVATPVTEIRRNSNEPDFIHLWLQEGCLGKIFSQQKAYDEPEHETTCDTKITKIWYKLYYS